MKKRFLPKICTVVVLAAVLLVFANRAFLFLKETQKLKKARQDFLTSLEPSPLPEIAGIMLISNFNEREHRTSLGEFGAWDKDPNDYTQGCFDSLSPTTRRGKKGYSLRMDYDVDSPSPAFNGVWFSMGGLDLTEYKYLVFWAKGDKQRGYTKELKLELKHASGEKGSYYVTDIGEDWTEHIIPLDQFIGIVSRDRIERLTVVFEDWRATAKEGTVYIDDMYLSKGKILDQALDVLYPTLRERIPKPDITLLSDLEFLELIQKKSFGYFWQETNPENGLVKDKANNFKKDDFKVSSIAAVGFALSCYPVAVEKGWITKEEALNRTLNTLLCFRDKMENVHGFYYHFVGMDNGKRVWNCELSSIDTALFLAGALFAGEYFGHQVKELADEIYRRVDWNWMMAEGDTMSMGWTPEKGFLPERWNKYGEQLIMYLLAIGSPTHSVSPEVWDRFRRPVWEYEGYVSLASPPMFTHQYSHIWVDFRNKQDKYIDYFRSSKAATLANRKFCINNRHNSLSFREHSWGLTACESPAGYFAYGAPPGYGFYDGTVAFTAVGGSIPFAPVECIAALRGMYQNHKNAVWGKYGFSDSFNLDKNWYSESVIGIDQGPIVLMIENYLSGFVWDYFMRNEHIQKAMDLVGFKPGSSEILPDPQPVIYAQHAGRGTDSVIYRLEPQHHLEYGAITKFPQDLDCYFSLSWDENNLYLSIKVSDNEVVAQEDVKNIYKQDSVELYFVAGDGLLYWNNKKHFQIGFAPSSKDGEPVHYAWFQDKVLEQIGFKSSILKEGYQFEITIPFAAIGLNPNPESEIGFSIAVNDFDREDNTPNCKFNLYLVPQYDGGAQSGFELARLKLIKD
ncbi:MAG: glucoamylase family protein [Candidatus Omnitrophica bacterium]|nr:glucoamylase family protein [Candidatus Omnitrophota bacterium]